MTGRRTPLPFGLALALISGAAGLAHQIVWTRRLVDVLGANADTFSKVIGAFFLGLAFGAWLASRTKHTAVRFWLRVALAELSLAALALPLLFSAQMSNWVYQQAAPGSSLKFFLPLLLITPPATAMGLVIPWVLRALAAAENFSPAHAIHLYAGNMLGGVAGIAGVVLFALPAWGLFGASLAAIGLNLLVAMGAMAIDHWTNLRPDLSLTPGFSQVTAEVTRRMPPKRLPNPAVFITGLEPGANESSVSISNSQAAFLACASGFLVLALEVVLQLQFAQIAINSLFSNAIVLALVLVSLTIAAALVPRLVRWQRNDTRALQLALLVAAGLCATQPFLFTGLRGGVNILPYELPPLAYTLEVLKPGLLVICPLLLAAGLIFPLLLGNVIRHKTGENARRVATLFACNGVGGWLGAELGQGVIAPRFGLWGSMVLLAGGYATLLLTCHWRFMIYAQGSKGRVNHKSQIINTLAVAVAVTVCAWFARLLPQATIVPGERLAALQVGREGVVAALECGPGDWRMLFNNSYTLGGSKAQFNQERQALLPLLLHGRPESAATLGVATGGTVAGVALYPALELIDAIELSPLVLRYAQEYFGPYNRNVFADPRARFIQEDARWVIARERATYDVVIGDLFLPWRTGEGRLFTLEHFQNVRRSLKPGGLYCQWLPLFQLTRQQFDTIVRTFHKVFPDAFLLRGDFYCELPILGLVGGRSLEQIDWQKIEFVCVELRAAGKVTDPLVRHANGVAMMVLGPLPAPSPGPINSLANAWLEWDAGRNILGMKTPWFIGIPSAEYARDIQRAGNSMLPEQFRPAHESGQFFLTLEIAAKAGLPALGNLKSQLSERVPCALRQDSAADWRQWPMRVKPDFHSGPRANKPTAPQ